MIDLYQKAVGDARVNAFFMLALINDLHAVKCKSGHQFGKGAGYFMQTVADSSRGFNLCRVLLEGVKKLIECLLQ